MGSRVRRSSMSSREEERILDEYRRRFEDKSTKVATTHQRRERPPISPYLQSVAPRIVSTLSKRPQSASLKGRRRRDSSFSYEKPPQHLSQSFEGKTTDDYSSSFESSDSDDSNEKENHPRKHGMAPKSILRNRPSSAPMHRRSHTHEGTMETDSMKLDKKQREVPVFQRQPITIRCTAFKNGSFEDGVSLVAADVKQILIEATRKLGLNTAGRRVYLEDGSEAFRAKDIPFNASVFISRGESFRDPKKLLSYSGSLIASSSWTSKGVVLEGERKPVRRTMSHRLRNLTGKKSSRILVFLNGDGANGQEVVFSNDDVYPRLLDQCTAKLKMSSAARSTFGWHGKEVSSLEEVRQLDSCMKNGSTLILGPIWASSGEGFSPIGARNFVEGILWGINRRMEAAKERSEQLDYACNGEMSKVTHPDLISMPTDDIYTNIEQMSKEIEEMGHAKKKYEERLKVLKSLQKEQKRVGNAYTVQHIKEIESNDRILGQHGLRLKIYENGTDTDYQQVYVNMREILRGSEKQEKPEELIRMRFLEHLSHWHKPLDPSGPAKSTMVRRMFNKDGDEIMNVKRLENDQEIWLSYGEDFKSAHIMTVQVQLQPVMGFLVQGQDKVILKRDGEVELEADIKWEAHDGFPDDYNFLRVEKVGEKSDSFSPNDHYLRAKNDSSLIVKPILMGGLKLDKKPLPGTSQTWVVRHNGLITSRTYPQLALCLDRDQPITVEMSCGAEVTGYGLTLQKKARGNPAQQWEFSPSGQICSLYNPSVTQVLTMLDRDNFNAIEIKGQRLVIRGQKDGDQTTPSQHEADMSLRMVALERLTGSRGKFQRWALKQGTPDEWKHTKVANMSWKKLAYSWPVLPDGNWNRDYKWPMEGIFVNCPPPLREKEKKDATKGREKNKPKETVPLTVFRNGEKNPKRFVTVVVPNLSTSTLANDKSTPNAEENVIRLEMNMFLERATSLLNLAFAARRIFSEHGREIYSLRKLKRNQIVYVTCGEPWNNPTVTKTNAQRRQLLAKLTADVKRINEYCVLRNHGDVVVAMESGIVLASRLVVTQQIQIAEPPEEDKKDLKESEAEEKSGSSDEKEESKSFHQKAHESSDTWIKSRKYPWQLEKTDEAEPEVKIEEKKSPRSPRLRSPRPWQKDPLLLQKFVFKDGFLSPEGDQSLAIGFPGLDLESLSGAVEVRLCRKDAEDMTQRWDIRSDGTIRLVCDNTAGLAVCLPAISNTEEPSPKNYILVLQKLKSQAVGSANQHWHLDPKTHMLKAFYSSVADKEVTAANHVSVCTYAVRGPEPLNQDGYIVEMRGSLPSNPVMVCRSCATVMRGGKHNLTRAPANWSFICAMGDAKKHGLRLQGSFKCLNGKIDLSTYEAEPTLNHWVSQLQRLRQETSLRSINRDLNNVECTQAWRLLIRRNGEGYRSKPEMIVGSSVTGVLDQCSHKLRLASAARRLYTEDGTQILHMDQLKQWVEKVGKETRKGSLVQQAEGRTAATEKDDGNTGEGKADKTNDGTNSTEGTPDHSTAEYGTQDLTRKPKKSKQTSVPQAAAEKLMLDTQSLPVVEIWVSLGENFINPVMADKMTQESLVAHTERNAKNLEMDTQKHVIRQLHGRRRGHLNPAELVATKDTKQPVIVTGGWTESTKEESERIVVYNQIKESQKPKRPKSAARLQGTLYKQPKMKRIVVRAVDDPSTSVYVWGETMDTLLDGAASRLGVRRIARLFYTQDGRKIRNFEQIDRNMELLIFPKRPGSTIRMKTDWARTRKTHGPEATEIVLTSPRNDRAISYVPPTNQIIMTSSSSSSSSSSSESDDE